MQASGGEVVVECAVETIDGVKEADCAWMSQSLWNKVKDEYACSPAPEICVEVLSPDNTRKEMKEKKALYFAAGAVEVWFRDRKGAMTFFLDADSDGAPASKLCPEFPPRIA